MPPNPRSNRTGVAPVTSSDWLHHHPSTRLKDDPIRTRVQSDQQGEVSEHPVITFHHQPSATSGLDGLNRGQKGPTTGRRRQALVKDMHMCHLFIPRVRGQG